MAILTLLDATGIQRYLYGSNRLKHNVGASYLIEEAAREAARGDGGWLLESLREIGVAESALIYAGGGNAVLQFVDEAQARAFTYAHSTRLLCKAPGLSMAVHHQPITGSLALAYQCGLGGLAKKKAMPPLDAPMPGLGVTAQCHYTNQPAVAKDDDGRWVSAEIQAKQAAHEQAKKRLRTQFGNVLGADYEFTYDFDQFGTAGDASYLAVVHADGNGIGRRKKALCDEHIEKADDAAFIRDIRQFSQDVRKAGDNALKDTIQKLQDWLKTDRAAGLDFDKRRDDETQKKLLPFVPLIYGGDDITFICDGRLGLSLAAHFLKIYEKQTVCGVAVSACAGVAVVKKRFPFSQAYKLAEELARNAKRDVRHQEASAIDWHFGFNGVLKGLSELRESDYEVDDGKLYKRPYFISEQHPARDRQWRSFETLVSELTSGEWHDSRNKVKQLREVLRQGKEATRVFSEAYLGSKELPRVDGLGLSGEYQKTGWSGNCVYFDAIEAMDLFEPEVRS